MHITIYVRVSTQRQAQTQTIDQQLDRLRRVVADRQWQLTEDHVCRDDGYSGAFLRRPGLDELRDLAALAKLDRILITDPIGWPATTSTMSCCWRSYSATAARWSSPTGRSPTSRRTSYSCRSAGRWPSTSGR